MIIVRTARQADLEWCKASIVAGHYLHTWPDPRTRPLAYVVEIPAGPRIGCLTFGRPEATRCYRGELTYGSRHQQLAGDVAWDRWELLNLSRVWIHPDAQAGGPLCRRSTVPGFADRAGVWRSSLASTAVLRAIEAVGVDYLIRYPPVYLGMPYQIRVVLSYCDRSLHRGYLYRACGFALARVNRHGIETWWTDRVRPLSEGDDREIRRLSAMCPRGARLRQASSATRGGAP
jgi:hypothetical protein